VFLNGFPKKRRHSLPVFLIQEQVLCVLVALFLVPWILSRYGWHEVFLITGGLGFVWMIFWHFFYSTPSKSKFLTKQELALIRDDNAESDHHK